MDTHQQFPAVASGAAECLLFGEVINIELLPKVRHCANTGLVLGKQKLTGNRSAGSVAELSLRLFTLALYYGLARFFRTPRMGTIPQEVFNESTQALFA
jgi:hypothetical protein